MSANTLIFIVVFVISIAFFGWSCYNRFRLVALGKPDDRLKEIAKRVWSVIYYPLAQRCTISHGYRFGINHAILFWAFVLLLIANTEFLLHGLAPDYIGLSKLPAGAYHALAWIFDIASIIALLAVCSAVIRRLVFPPSYIDAKSGDAFVILGLISALMLAFFGMHGAEIAMGTEKAVSYMPISAFAGTVFFSGMSAGALETAVNVFWWIHAIVLLAFLNYLPYSKHMHILTSIPNCFFRSLETVNTQPRETFAKGNVYGTERIDQFTWKDLFDSYSCTECGRCVDNCPAASTGKALDPKKLIHNIKVNMLQNGPGLVRNGEPTHPLIGIDNDKDGSVSEEAIWDCTTCGACMEVCPVFIEHVPKVVDMRRNLVEMKAKFPHELLNFFENMEGRSNPWGIAPEKRTAWMEEAGAKPFEAGVTEYLFFVGCSGALDPRGRHVTLATAKVLNAAGISWGVLGKEELCCGDSMRRLGNEYIFDSMAQENVNLFKEKGVKKIIVQCPHCYNTLKNDYRQYGGDFEVIHHAEFINSLIEKKKLKFNGSGDFGKVVFHDSCYLGRYNSIYEEPRKVIAAVTNKAPAEMERNHEKAFCCGGGGGRMWMEESAGDRIYIVRTEQALKEKPDTICTCCPFCMTMFEDGLKDKESEDSVRVLDLAEIVAEALE
ncbi:MAG: 4Fe-4S dicluster domain-containing protein [Deltaproteobacteria bacterium]|nr:4Fe-4S dicluster domain-containing protein [Deltaproteobacteria bacterium]